MKLEELSGSCVRYGSVACPYLYNRREPEKATHGWARCIDAKIALIEADMV